VPRTFREPLAPLGRFARVGFDVLVALSNGPKHSYAMLLDIEARGASAPGPGTLYAAIAALEERRWIEPLVTDDPRRPYQITPDGQQALRAHAAAQSAEITLATPRLADV
jgi:DNA-binding PadR family transcriptional regulator